MTFAEFAQAMQKMAQKVKGSKDAENVDMSFNASVKETGQAKTLQGMDAKQVILSMEMEGTDMRGADPRGMPPAEGR